VGGAVMTAFAVLMLLLALLGRPKGP